MTTGVYPQFLAAKHHKKLAVLIDPDSLRLKKLDQLIQRLQDAQPDFLMVGGSLILDDQLDYCLDLLKAECSCPLVLFPGSALQISSKADAILFLSLISGRNPEYLIGQHVLAAPYIKAAGLEVISTGYMLIDGGQATTASYMSNSMPIPRDKPEIAVCTAMAGEMLGLKTIYLDASYTESDDCCGGHSNRCSHHCWWWYPQARKSRRSFTSWCRYHNGRNWHRTGS